MNNNYLPQGGNPSAQALYQTPQNSQSVNYLDMANQLSPNTVQGMTASGTFPPQFQIGGSNPGPLPPNTLPLMTNPANMSSYLPGLGPMSPTYIHSPTISPEQLMNQYVLNQQQYQQLLAQQALLQQQGANLPQGSPVLQRAPPPPQQLQNHGLTYSNSQPNLGDYAQLQNQHPAPHQTQNNASGLSPSGYPQNHNEFLDDLHQRQTLQDQVNAMPQTPAPPHTYQAEPLHPNRKNLPFSLPTKLNPSLQINTGPSSDHNHHDAPTTRVSPRAPTGSNHLSNGLMRGTSCESSQTESQDDQATSGRGSSISSSVSPPGSSPTSPYMGRCDPHWRGVVNRSGVRPCYSGPANPELCLRCHKKVYAMEKVGPIKGMLYHKMCFTCVICGTKLSLKNFHHNPLDIDDLNVFCVSHKPQDRGSAWDSSAVHIQSALNVPKLDKVNEQIRGDRDASVLARIKPAAGPAVHAVYATREQYYYGMPAQAETPYVEMRKEEILAPTPAVNHHPNTISEEQQSTSQVIEKSVSVEASSKESTPLDENQNQTRLSTSGGPDDVFRRQDSVLSEKSERSELSIKTSPASSLSSSSSSLSRRDRPSAESVTMTQQTDSSQLQVSATTTTISSQHQQIQRVSSWPATIEESDPVDIAAQSLSDKIIIDTGDEKEQRDNHSQTDPPRQPGTLPKQASLPQLPSVPQPASPRQRAPPSSSDAASCGVSRVSGGSSRSGSPIHMRIKSDASEDVFSPRSSTSSTSSFRMSGGDVTSTTHRADRPSASSLGDSFNGGMPAAVQRSSAARMMVKSQSSHELYLQKARIDASRVLPKNETRRMDRPSQNGN